MKALQRAEYDDQTDEEFMTSVYRQLEWVRIRHKYQPGWTYYVFREAFADAAPRVWMKTLEPQEPCREVLLWLERRNAAYKRGKAYERSGSNSAMEGRPDEAHKTEHHHAGGDV